MSFLRRYPRWLIAMIGAVLVLDVILILTGKAGYVVLWVVLLLVAGTAGRAVGRRAAERRRARDEDLRR